MNGKYILLHGGILLAVGIYAAEFITWNLLGSGIVLALLLSMIFISYIWKRKSIVYIGSALFICFAGFIRMEIAENLWQNQSLYLAGHKGDFYGVIAEEPTETAGENEYSRYLINLDKIIYPDGEEKEISGKVYVYDPSKHGKYEIGDKIIAKGELRPVHIYKNPGKINLEKRYKSLSVIGRIYGEREGDISFISHSNEYYLLQKSVSVREEIKSIFAPYVEAEHLPVLMTLLFGGHYSEIPESVITSFSTTGIIHILSVSGSHIVLLFGFLYIVGKYLGLPRKITAGLSIIFVLVYGGIAGFVPPVVRSSVMGILTVLAVFTERDREPLNLLGAAVSGMLLFNPYYLYDISFQLSVLASAGILLFYRPLSGLFSSVPKIPSWIKDGAALSLSAQILLVPVILYYFHVFPLYFIPANLLVTPLLECVIIAGLSAIILSFLIKPLAIGVLYGADYLLGFGLMLNNLIASLPNASIRLGGMTILQMISYYALISIFYFKGKWKSFTKGIFAVKICTGILILLCVLESFLKPETSVFVPELGSDRGILIISKKCKIIYYKYSDFYSKRNTDEFSSFLSYEGVFDADILILCGKNGEKGKITYPKIPVKEIWMLGEPLKLNDDFSGTVRYLKNGTVRLKNGIRIGIDGTSLDISNKDRSVYIAGGTGKNRRQEKHGLWIGGAHPFEGQVEYSFLKEIKPEMAVYTGKGAMAGEDTEAFLLYGCPVYETIRDGMVEIKFTDKGWKPGSTGSEMKLWQ